ncbi:hypothetical protein KR009_008021 [Drosophila setifemur]|nr:hypothetical protein KR009_008021 [Drosophila setifemur]
MLKRKLDQQKANLDREETQKPALSGPEEAGTSSKLFCQPLWQQFYNIEVKLNEDLDGLTPPPDIACIYNPVQYASSLHCSYLRRYLDGPKKLVFIGMNPGPNGMGQTGIPFGNVRTVKVLMQLSGSVDKPPVEHPARPVDGLSFRKEEVSGVRLWDLFLRLSGNMETFARQCFVHNFCPLAFFSAKGNNLTPSELKGPYKKQIGTRCLEAFDQQLLLLKPMVIVAVGKYVLDLLKKSEYCQSVSVSVLGLPHPSPRSAKNTNWGETAQAFLEEHNLIRLMRNEA